MKDAVKTNFQLCDFHVFWGWVIKGAIIPLAPIMSPFSKRSDVEARPSRNPSIVTGCVRWNAVFMSNLLWTEYLTNKWPPNKTGNRCKSWHGKVEYKVIKKFELASLTWLKFFSFRWNVDLFFMQWTIFMQWKNRAISLQAFRRKGNFGRPSLCAWFPTTYTEKLLNHTYMACAAYIAKTRPARLPVERDRQQAVSPSFREKKVSKF